MKKIGKTLLVIYIIYIIIFANLKVFANEIPQINAKSSILVERNTGKIIYEENSKEQNYPASVTKILTAIIVIENCKLDDVATVSQAAISQVPSEYIVAPLYVGEQIKIEDLLYALMLKSANDAAYVLAEHVGGSVEGFADIMNKKAEEIGCKNSHFVNPNGIQNSNHYTTAYDLYLISDYAMKNETFAKIVSTYQYTLSGTNKHPNKDRVMTNTNYFIDPNSSYYDENVKGIKTGTTLAAGNCLVTDSAKDGLEFIAVVLGVNSKIGKFDETNKLLNYAFENYSLTKMYGARELIKTVDVDKAEKDANKLNVVIDNEIIVMKNNSINLEEIEPEIKWTKDFVAPIKEGEELGTITFNVDGLEYSAKLVAGNNIDRKTYYKEIAIIGGSVCVIAIAVILLKLGKRGRGKSKTNKRRYSK